MIIDGMPQHVKDLCPIIDSGTSMCDTNDDLTSDSEQVIELSESSVSTDAYILETDQNISNDSLVSNSYNKTPGWRDLPQILLFVIVRSGSVVKKIVTYLVKTSTSMFHVLSTVFT